MADEDDSIGIFDFLKSAIQVAAPMAIPALPQNVGNPAAPAVEPGKRVGGQAGSPLPLGQTRVVGGQAGEPYSGSQAQYLDGLLAQLDSFAQPTSGGGGGGSNNAARAAAFNAQRDAQVNAYNNQITGLQSTLEQALLSLGEITGTQIQGINESTRNAKTTVKNQRQQGRQTIDRELNDLLGLLASGLGQIQAEGATTDAVISGRGVDARSQINASNDRLAVAGGGAELAAATQEALARSLQVQAIDQALGGRLSQAATQDNTRRVQGGQSVAASAQQDLTNNVLQMLGQLTQAATQARTDARASEAQNRFQLEQDYARQISDAQTQRDLAAAQRFVPAASSGGGSSSRTLLPSEQIAQAQVQAQIEGILNPVQFDPLDQFLGGLDYEGLLGNAQAQSDASGDVGPVIDVIRAIDSIRG